MKKSLKPLLLFLVPIGLCLTLPDIEVKIGGKTYKLIEKI